MPTDDVSALARLREKLVGMTPGPWKDVRFGNHGMDVVSDAASTPIAMACDPDDAAGIVHAVSLARFVADEGTVERVARMLDAVPKSGIRPLGQDWFDDAWLLRMADIEENREWAEREKAALITKARAILALIASAGEEA